MEVENDFSKVLESKELEKSIDFQWSEDEKCILLTDDGRASPLECSGRILTLAVKLAVVPNRKINIGIIVSDYTNNEPIGHKVSQFVTPSDASYDRGSVFGPFTFAIPEKSSFMQKRKVRIKVISHYAGFTSVTKETGADNEPAVN